MAAAEQPQQTAQRQGQLPTAAVQHAFQGSLVGLAAGGDLGVFLVQFGDLLVQQGYGLLLGGHSLFQLGDVLLFAVLILLQELDAFQQGAEEGLVRQLSSG